ncbi:MAG: MarR family transcriptional regulator [Sphingobium sp.]|nr:MarR family transcriptional regulator [Sphingobium sp.]
MESASPLQPDLITTLGYLCLGSRLKRLGERMQAGVAQHLAARGDAVQPAQLPLLRALHLDGPMTINALSDRVGISQPGVSRAIATLEELGLVASLADAHDRRQRRIGIAPPGRALMDDLTRTLFPVVEAAVEQLCSRDGLDFLAEIGRIESGLATEPLDGRIGRRMRESGHG